MLALLLIDPRLSLLHIVDALAGVLSVLVLFWILYGWYRHRIVEDVAEKLVAKQRLWRAAFVGALLFIWWIWQV